jgi:hypothetical protein
VFTSYNSTNLNKGVENMYKVLLNSCGNPDYGQDPNQPFENAVASVATRNTIEECQFAVREYIDTHNLGGGHFIGGEVYTDNNEYVGLISYNGRFWDKSHEYGKQRTLGK